MSLRELDIISRQFKSSQDATVIRKDVNLFGKELKKEIVPFVNEIEKTAKKEKLSQVILLAILYDPTKIQ
jgi:hypothetical protein